MIHFITDFVELEVPMSTSDEILAGYIIAAEAIARKVFGDAFVDAYAVSFESKLRGSKISGWMNILTPGGRTVRCNMIERYEVNVERGIVFFYYGILVPTKSTVAITGIIEAGSSQTTILINNEVLIYTGGVVAFYTGARLESSTLPVPAGLATCALTPYYLAGDFKTEIYHTSLSGSGWHGIGGQLYYVERALAYKID